MSKEVTITIGARSFSTTRLRGDAPSLTAGRLRKQVEAAGYKLFTARREEILAAVVEQVQDLLDAEARDNAADEALLAEWPGATIAGPSTNYPFHRVDPASVRDIREALALRKGGETRITIRRYEGGFPGGSDVVHLRPSTVTA